MCQRWGLPNSARRWTGFPKAYRELDAAIQAVNWTVEMAGTLS